MSPPDDERQGSLLLFDGHVDLLHALTTCAFGVPFDRVEKGPVTLERLKAGRIGSILSAVYIPDAFNGSGRSSRRLCELLSYSRDYVEPWLERQSASEPLTTSNDKTVFSLLLENGDALVDLGIPFALEVGIVAVGLTHNGRNRLGDGCHVAHPEGLTQTGRRIVVELDRSGIAIDLAHLSEPAFDQVLDLIEKPPICTHTGLRRFVDTPRNLSYEQAERIIERGGVIGLCAAPEMISPNKSGTIDDLFRHIDHLVQRFGLSGVAIGSDFGGFDGALTGFEDHSKIRNLIDLMRRSGYTDRGISATVGVNWERFFNEIRFGKDSPSRRDEVA